MLNSFRIVTIIALILIIIFFVILFVVILKTPLEQQLNIKPNIDLIIIDKHNNIDIVNKTEKNVKQHVTFINKTFSVRNENDILSKLSLARLSRFFLIIETGTLLTSKLTHEDLFSSDQVAFIHTQNISLKTNNEKDINILKSMLPFFTKNISQPTDVPVLADKEIINLILTKINDIPDRFYDYFYPNYVLSTSKASESTNLSFQFISSFSKNIYQRKFIILDPTNELLFNKIYKLL
jgi:hypothetical protein